MAKNKEAKSTSMLGVMMKCLHGGPSLIISITPVHNLDSAFQYSVVKKDAAVIEKSGRSVLGSITDNHKLNQHYCKLFEKILIMWLFTRLMAADRGTCSHPEMHKK